MNRFVKSSLEYKKVFIEIDEFDRGERIKLNFAHTFGHAIETVTHYEIPHGTAVAIGMIMANRISVDRKILDSRFSERCENVLMKVITADVRLLEVSMENFIDAIRKDKKQTGMQMTGVLMSDQENDLIIVHDLKKEEIMDALYYFLDRYKRERNNIS